MTEQQTTEAGHCKDVAHVRVELVPAGGGAGKGFADGVFVPSTSCVNVPGYSGWVVQLFTAADTPHPRPGLRLLPELAEVFPVWLRRAARAADADGSAVSVQHTNEKAWLDYVTLTPAGARWLAKSVLRAVELAPPGAHG